MTDDDSLPLLAELSARLENAQGDFQRMAGEAFSQLEVIDPELVAAVLELFGDRQAALRYLATIQFDERPNAYAVLAAGERSRIMETLDRVKHGIF